MPTASYLSITGQTQGNITKGAFTKKSVGNVYVEGHEDQVLVQAIAHDVHVPINKQSGQPSGQRVHEPLIINSHFNKSVPLLYNALTTGELLNEVCLQWYRTSIEGRQEAFFTTRLIDAIIVAISCHMPNCQSPKGKIYTPFIEVAFSYRKIEWEHIMSGTAGADDWRKPLV